MTALVTEPTQAQAQVPAAAAFRRLLRAPLVSAAAAILVSTVATSGVGYLYWMLAARTLSPAAVGEATALVAALSTVALLSSQTLTASVLGRLPRRAVGVERSGLVAAALLVSGVVSLVLAGAAVLLLPALSASFSVLSVPLVAVLFVVAACSQSLGLVVDASAVALRRGRVMTSRNAAHSLGKLALLALLVFPFAASGPVAVLASWGAVGLVVTSASALRVLRRAGITFPPFSALRAEFSSLRSGAGAQTVTALCGALPPQLLPLLVAVQLSATATGHFSLTWLLGGVAFMVSPAVCSALLAEGAHEPGALMRRTRLSLVLVGALLAVPLAAFVLFPSTLLSVFGSGVASAGAALLVVLAVSALPDALSNVGVALLRVEERLRAAAVVNASIAVVTLLGAWVLTPSLGLVGPGVAWLVAQCVGCLALTLPGLRPSLRSLPAAPASGADVVPSTL